MHYADSHFEIKSVSDAGVIEGVISSFGHVDSYGDRIEAGAYTKSLAKLNRARRQLPVLYQHDQSQPIGVWTDLKETATGLIGRAELAMGVRAAAEAHQLAKMGALTGISIGYVVPKDGHRSEGNVRILSEIDLREASLVTFPADDHARVSGVKSLNGARDIAELLQEGGMSVRKAKIAAGAAWKAINEPQDDNDGSDALAALIVDSTNRIARIGRN